MTRRLLRPLHWAVFGLPLAWGCGARSPVDSSEDAPGDSSFPESGVEEHDSSSDASVTTTADSSESDDPTADADCLSSVLTFDPSGATFQACWSCAKNVCASQLAACAADCTCNSTVASALACVQDGLSVETCFQATFGSTSDTVEASVEACLLQQAYSACNCAAVLETEGGASREPDAATTIGPAPGMTLPGIGNVCFSIWGGTSGSTPYQVTCTCPDATCTCFGPTTHVVTYPGCPRCSPTIGGAELFALCGFPPYVQQ